MLFLYFTVIWVVVTLVGLLHYRKKRKFKSSFRISSIFLVLCVLVFFSIPACYKINNLKNAYKKAELLELEETKNLNSKDNYQVSSCKDLLDEEGIINVECVFSVKTKGKYIVKGKLYKNNPRKTGYDEVILESHPAKFDVDDDTIINIPFVYRHSSRNESVPDGPFVIEIILVPEGDLKSKLNPYTFGGFKSSADQSDKEFITEFYEGGLFENLPYKDVTIF